MKLSSISVASLTAAIKMIAALPVGRSLRKLNNKCWIITERPDQARDNGLVFFKYMRKEHPEAPVYYVIDKKAPDYEKIRDLGNVIQFDSFRHYLMFCKAPMHISAHVYGCCPAGASSVARRLKRIIDFYDVFLPHGVSYGVSEFCLKKYTDINLFICSGKPEYDNVLEHYGYAPDEVAYTGFPRLDIWHNRKTNPKQIVLMPTWRAYLAQDPNLNFEESSYYKEYQKLLNSAELEDFLKKKDAKLIFYLHNEMRRFADSFQTADPRIEIVYQDHVYDIQELLKESAMLITDYSSVHFDFAYMNKPVIYYQFDREEFFERQYQKSGFDAAENGFGPVCESVHALCMAMEELFTDEGHLNPVYYSRMRAFYQLYDDQNCERVYQAIREKEKIDE